MLKASDVDWTDFEKNLRADLKFETCDYDFAFVIKGNEFDENYRNIEDFLNISWDNCNAQNKIRLDENDKPRLANAINDKYWCAGMFYGVGNEFLKDWDEKQFLGIMSGYDIMRYKVNLEMEFIPHPLFDFGE